MIARHYFKNDRMKDFRTGCRNRRDVVNLLRYIQKESGMGECIANDFAGEDPLQIADEVDLLDGGHAIKAFHFGLNFLREEQTLWEPRAAAIVEDLKRTFGATHAYARSHLDRDGTWHIHIFLLATRADGGQVRLTRRQRNKAGRTVTIPTGQILREICERWEDKVPGVRKTGRGETEPTYSKNELEMAERQHREGAKPTRCPDKMLLTERVNFLVAATNSIGELVAAGAAEGISVKVTDHAAGKGISFSDGTVSLRGSAAGWTYKKLEAHYGNKPDSDTDGGGAGAPARPSLGKDQPYPGGAGRLAGGRALPGPGAAHRRANGQTRKRPDRAQRERGQVHPVSPSQGWFAVIPPVARRSPLAQLIRQLLDLIHEAGRTPPFGVPPDRPAIP